MLDICYYTNRKVSDFMETKMFDEKRNFLVYVKPKYEVTIFFDLTDLLPIFDYKSDTNFRIVDEYNGVKGNHIFSESFGYQKGTIKKFVDLLIYDEEKYEKVR